MEAYQGRDDFAVGEGSIAGRRAGGLAWTGYGVGEFALKDEELRWVAGGRPGWTAVGVDAGATRMPLICWLKRESNGLAAIQIGGSYDEQLRLRFLDGETRLETVDGSGVSLLATGTELAQGEWRRLEVTWERGALRVVVNNPGERLPGEMIAASGAALDHSAAMVGYGSGYRNAVDRWGSFGIGRRVFTGEVYRPVWPLGGEYLTVECRDDSAGWRERRVDGKIGAGVALTAGGALGVLAAGVGLSAGEYEYRGGAEVIRAGTPLALADVGAGDGLRALAEETHGHVAVDGGGILRFEGRSQRDAALAIAGGDAPEVELNAGLVAVWRIDVESGRDEVERSVEVVTRRPVLMGNQVVWDGRDVLAAPAGGSRDVNYALAGGDFYYAGTAEVTAGTLTANSAADGTGADVTADVAGEVVDGGTGAGGVVRLSNGGTAVAYVLGFTVSAGDAWRAGDALSYLAGGDGAGRDVVINAVFMDLHDAAVEAATERLATTGRERRAYVVGLLGQTNDAEVGAVVLRTRLGGGVKVVDGEGRWGLAGAFVVEGWKADRDGWELRLREG